jgi:hypothetical protein
MRVDDHFRRQIRVLLRNAFERDRLKDFDPFQLGELKATAEQIWSDSRRLNRAQQISLACLLRDVADAIEQRHM